MGNIPQSVIAGALSPMNMAEAGRNCRGQLNELARPIYTLMTKGEAYLAQGRLIGTTAVTLSGRI